MELPGLAPLPEFEEFELYGSELLPLLNRLEKEQRYIAVLHCGKKSQSHYCGTIVRDNLHFKQPA